MKITSFKEEMNKLNREQIQEKLDHVRKELFSLRLNSSTAHVKDYSQFKKLKRDIARLLTTIQQQELREQDTEVTNES